MKSWLIVPNCSCRGGTIILPALTAIDHIPRIVFESENWTVGGLRTEAVQVACESRYGDSMPDDLSRSNFASVKDPAVGWSRFGSVVILLSCLSTFLGCQPLAQQTGQRGELSADLSHPTYAATQPIQVEAAFRQPVEVAATLKPVEGESGVHHVRIDPTTQTVKIGGVLPLQIEPATRPILFELAHPIQIDATMHLERDPPASDGKTTVSGPAGTATPTPPNPPIPPAPTPITLGVWWLTCIGAWCFGLVIGWITYRSIRRAPTPGLTDIATVIGAIGGSAVVALFPAQSGVFGVYCIGLACGFFGYLLIAMWIDGKKSVSLWLGSAPVAGHGNVSAGQQPVIPPPP